MSETLEVTDDTFEAEVLQSEMPAIVDFWAEWCAPCRAISPIVEQLSKEYGDRLKIVKMDIDQNPRTPGQYEVRAIPTVLAFRGGQVVEQLVGARPKAAFDEMVRKLLEL